MDNKIKLLIAVGASVTANCQPCLKTVISSAQENGVKEKEILEAIAVANMVRKGAMGKMDQFASTLIGNTKVAADDSEKECDCS